LIAVNVSGPLTNVPQSSGDRPNNVDSLTLSDVSTATSAGSRSHALVNSGSTSSLPATVASTQHLARPTTAVSSDLISLATTTTTTTASSTAADGVTTVAGGSTPASAGNATLTLNQCFSTGVLRNQWCPRVLRYYIVWWTFFCEIIAQCIALLSEIIAQCITMFLYFAVTDPTNTNTAQQQTNLDQQPLPPGSVRLMMMMMMMMMMMIIIIIINNNNNNNSVIVP